MIPATHAAVAAVVASRVRNLPLALTAAFALHFVMDGIYHFESVYQVSVPGKWSEEQTMLVLFGGLAALATPLMIWIGRMSRRAGLFGLYALLMGAVALDPAPRWRLVWAALLTALWLAATPDTLGRRWILCGFAAYLPDTLKTVLPAVARLHELTHYSPNLDLGDWLSLLARGKWRIDVNARVFDPYYQIGYALEFLIEATLLFGPLFWLAKRNPNPILEAQKPEPTPQLMTEN